EFLYSAAELRQHPVNDHAVPEILVMGASNVGKSSLLNSLFGRRDMARASKEPGKTTLMNAYGVGKPAPKHGLILMDTPGYGFGSRNEWGQNIMTYIEKRKALRGALVLISAEKKLNDEDRWLLRQLASASTRITVVLTRADKLGGGLEQSCMNLASQLWKTA
ncbi:P-loop containing nucleoside triphosphate hydrolase protein, partial [Sarocladium strictum]